MPPLNSIRRVAVRHDVDQDFYSSFASSLHAIWHADGRKPRIGWYMNPPFVSSFSRSPCRLLGLAVSGGVDSMALAALCHHATTTPHHPSGHSHPPFTAAFTALIVDHGVRPDSAAEAAHVAHELRRLHMDPHILPLHWPRAPDRLSPLPNFETLARHLRYRALGLACRRHGLSTLLVAHHADDVAETTLTRLLAGYDGAGLASLRPRAPLPECHGMHGVHAGGVVVCRPLLTVRKTRLVRVCRRHNVRWFEDPSNADASLTLRNTVRMLHHTQALPEALRPSRMCWLARRMHQRNSARDADARQLLSSLPCRQMDVTAGTIEFAVDPLILPADTTPSILALVLRMMLEPVTPKPTISLQSLDSAVDVVFCANDGAALCTTDVAGVHIERSPLALGGHRIYMHRSLPTASEVQQQDIRLWPRRSPLSGGEQADGDDLADATGWRLWDGRYWIRIIPPIDVDMYSAHGTPLHIRHLSVPLLADLRKQLTNEARAKLDSKLHAFKGKARFTLPAIVALGGPRREGGEEPAVDVRALPSLNFHRGDMHAYTGTLNEQWQWEVRYRELLEDG